MFLLVLHANTPLRDFRVRCIIMYADVEEERERLAKRLEETQTLIMELE